MTSSALTASDLYAKIVDALASDPSLEQALLADLDGTVAQRFGVSLPKPAQLARTDSGFRLTYDNQVYDLGDPRNSAKGELNDAELELVAGGADGCPTDSAPKNRPEGNFPSMPMPSLPPR